MNTFSFQFCGATLEARPSGALWWAEARLLCVADLHLGKSERIARRGGTLLPPYETRDTLERLSQEISLTDPEQVIALGDSFDDLGAAAALCANTREQLLSLSAGRHWTWITGNHDPGPVDLPGAYLAERKLGPIVFRHIAEAEAKAEISGHYHPKARLGGTSRPCFLVGPERVILPAFGTYTGGLDCLSVVLRAIAGDPAFAVLTGRRALPVPLAPQRQTA